MKKFIALALALAMMVSCLVFTASAEDSVAVTLQGPTTVAKDGTFQVKVRVTDTRGIVGGVQGVVDVTGATVKEVEVNPELETWNNTQDAKTVYKLENNDVTFASLNKLESNYTTRVWFIITYNVEADAKSVTVELKNVKVSDKQAKAVALDSKSDLTIDVIDTKVDPNVSLKTAGIDGTKTNIMANDQAMLVGAEAKNIGADNVTDVGVVFYPTALLGGADLTVETDGAIVANVNKEADPDTFNKIISNNGFVGVLEFNFTDETLALKFLGTVVTARVYYKTSNDEFIYASNASDDAYINNGTVSKAALNTILDKAGAIESPTFGTVKKYTDASKGVNTGDENWAKNRAYVLEYCVKNSVSN